MRSLNLCLQVTLLAWYTGIVFTGTVDKVQNQTLEDPLVGQPGDVLIK